MTTRPLEPCLDVMALRRGVLAASVLDDIPLEPAADGVAVGDDWDDRDSWTPVPWARLERALGGVEPESQTGRLRLRDSLRNHAAVRRAGSAVAGRLVTLALPTDHVLHPGAGWVVEPVLGGVLDLGLALRPRERGLAVPLATELLEDVGVDVTACWVSARSHLESMGALAIDRLARDGKGVLGPIGGCDVLTLLAGAGLRRYLARADGTGMRAIAAPMRSRAWFDLARIDPAFVGAAATATEPEQRGLSRPLLVTVDEVATVLTRPVIDLARAALADDVAIGSLIERDVLYR